MLLTTPESLYEKKSANFLLTSYFLRFTILNGHIPVSAKKY